MKVHARLKNAIANYSILWNCSECRALLSDHSDLRDATHGRVTLSVCPNCGQVYSITANVTITEYDKKAEDEK